MSDDPYAEEGLPQINAVWLEPCTTECVPHPTAYFVAPRLCLPHAGGFRFVMEHVPACMVCGCAIGES